MESFVYVLDQRPHTICVILLEIHPNFVGRSVNKVQFFIFIHAVHALPGLLDNLMTNLTY